MPCAVRSEDSRLRIPEAETSPASTTMASEGTNCGRGAVQRSKRWASGLKAIARKNTTPASPISRQTRFQRNSHIPLLRGRVGSCMFACWSVDGAGPTSACVSRLIRSRSLIRTTAVRPYNLVSEWGHGRVGVNRTRIPWTPFSQHVYYYICTPHPWMYGHRGVSA